MYATKDNFPYCDSSYLSVDYRKKFAWLEIAGNKDHNVFCTSNKNHALQHVYDSYVDKYECMFITFT